MLMRQWKTEKSRAVSLPPFFFISQSTSEQCSQTPQKNPHTPTLQPQCMTVLHNADLCQHCNRKLFHRLYERRKNKHVEGSQHKYKCPASQNNINWFYKGYVYSFLLTDPNECSTIYSYPIVSFIVSVTYYSSAIHITYSKMFPNAL